MTYVIACLAERERAFAKGVEHGEFFRQWSAGKFAAKRFFTFNHSFEIKAHFAPDRNVRSNYCHRLYNLPVTYSRRSQYGEGKTGRISLLCFSQIGFDFIYKG